MNEEIKGEEIKEEGDKAEGSKKKESEDKDRYTAEILKKMTVKELREIAVEIPGISGVHAIKKEELLSIIKKEKGIEEKELEKGRKRKKHKPVTSIADMKKKIVQLRKEKEMAHKTKDRHSLDILRRRINRYKKRIRKAPQG